MVGEREANRNVESSSKSPDAHGTAGIEALTMRPIESPRFDRWEPPSRWVRFRSVDAHAAGEPLRIVVEGFPDPPGGTMLAKRRHAAEHLDGLRRVLMWEPRGHADMYGCVVTEPVTPDGDMGVLFLHNAGFSTMCGHGVIALAAAAVETGLIETGGTVRIDTPAGRVVATTMRDGDCVAVTFRNVPSFVVARDVPVQVPGLGEVTVDVAFGGAFYAYVDSSEVGIPLEPAATNRLIDAGRSITQTVAETVALHHPDGDPDLAFLYGTIFTGPPASSEAHSRHACVFAEGELDRSPTGTGVSGRLALLDQGHGPLPGELAIFESILATTFTGRVVERTAVGGRPAVIPEIGGTGHITGRHEFLVDPADPVGGGFFLR